MEKRAARCGSVPRAGTEYGDDAGFILPLSLVTLAGVLILGTALFTVARFDVAIARSHDAALRAFYAAEAGLATALAEPPPGPAAVLTLKHPEGETTVKTFRLLAVDSTLDLYRIEARARVVGPGRLESRRTLVVLGLWTRDAAAVRRGGSWSERFR